MACSLKSFTGKTMDIDVLTRELQQLIVSNLGSSVEEIKRLYDASLYVSGEKVPFLLNGKQVQVTVVEVNMKGELVVQNQVGELLFLRMGDVKYLI